MKLESQLTVPATMKAAGRWDCWKNSPVRMNGMPPAITVRHGISHPWKAMPPAPVSPWQEVALSGRAGSA